MNAVQPSTELVPRNAAPPAVIPGPAQRSAAAVASVIGRQVFDVLAGRTRVERVRDNLTATVFGNLIGVRLHGALHPGYRLHSVHACAVGDSAVEACLIVGAHRIRALVLRIERQAERWVCTRLSPIERSAI